MRTIGFVSLLFLSGCLPVATAQPPGARTQCQRDADCTLVDVCGCACTAVLGPPLPSACSEACRGVPCEGHHAACVAGACVVR